MPLGNTSLSAGQLEFIRQWIEAGAPEAGEVADPKLLGDTALPVYAPFAPLMAPAEGKGLQVRIQPFDGPPPLERELFHSPGLVDAPPRYRTPLETSMPPTRAPLT